jgi:ABC-2 type transport system ATP-binding protein
VLSCLGLTKRYGKKVAVDDLTFDVQPGRVTGFLGPNGAGKTTAMRCIVRLHLPSAGEALIDGRPYDQHPEPLRVLGASIEPEAGFPNRTARDHLRILALLGGIPEKRIDAVLDMVGLEQAAPRKVGGLSRPRRSGSSLASRRAGSTCRARPPSGWASWRLATASCCTS